MGSDLSKFSPANFFLFNVSPTYTKHIINSSKFAHPSFVCAPFVKVFPYESFMLHGMYIRKSRDKSISKNFQVVI